MDQPIIHHEYNSQLPFMWDLIKQENVSRLDGRGMTLEQASLWGTVSKTRDRVLRDGRYRNADQAIQQYWLEYWVWGTHWPNRSFPGTYPTEKVMPQSPSSEIPRIIITEEEWQRNELLSAIMKHKGPSYIPFHGWDELTGLPRYAMICTANNGFRAFCGRGQEYFRAIRDHFQNVARIMYQRVPGQSLMVIWIEALTVDHLILLHENEAAWNAFKECWAFFKSWTLEYQYENAENTVHYLSVLMGKRGIDISQVDIQRPSIPREFGGGG